MPPNGSYGQRLPGSFPKRRLPVRNGVLPFVKDRNVAPPYVYGIDFQSLNTKNLEARNMETWNLEARNMETRNLEALNHGTQKHGTQKHGTQETRTLTK